MSTVQDYAFFNVALFSISHSSVYEMFFCSPLLLIVLNGKSNLNCMDEHQSPMYHFASTQTYFPFKWFPESTLTFVCQLFIID